MALVLTTSDLIFLDQATLKHPPCNAQPTCSLPSPPTCSVWSAESNSLFVITKDLSLLRYDASAQELQEIPVRPTIGHVTSITSKDRGSTLVCGRGQEIILLSSHTGKVATTLDTHKADVTSISLSNDGSLLASSSARGVHVHNLSLTSHTVLKGIVPPTGSVAICAFHPHTRTRLLVGLHDRFLVYDTTRPSGPAKVIKMEQSGKTLGAITAISSSPFSKTLVAVACSGGCVGLVDLEKEKGLVKVVPVSAPTACISFSAEGGSLYVGTENGKFLMFDLRTLDRPPKSITVSGDGDRVVTLSIAKKPAAKTAETAPPTKSATATKPLVQRDVNKVVATARSGATSGVDQQKKPADKAPTKARSSSLTVPPQRTPSKSDSPRRPPTRTVSNTGAMKVSSPIGKISASGRARTAAAAKSPPIARRSNVAEATRRAFSPPKSPLLLPTKRSDDVDDDEQSGDLSVRIENLLALPRPSEPVAHMDAPPPRGPSESALSRASSRAQARAPEETRPSDARPASATAVRSATGSARARAGSASSSVSARPAAPRSGAKFDDNAGSAEAPRRAPSPRRRISGTSFSISRTPSPEPAPVPAAPATPSPAFKTRGPSAKGKEPAPASASGARFGVLGLGTPDVARWVRAGEPDGRDGGAAREKRRVGFAGDSGDEGEGEAPARIAEPAAAERLAVQVSPRSYGGAAGWAPVPSPLRGAGAGGSPGRVGAQDLLQSLLRDALFEFRQETKAEIVGLHLDLIRMGGSWRREMREAMGEFTEELRELREENTRLREENERLRRGY